MPMSDRHLNLFYSYNQSREAELIENNLTRAFIQTLRALSGPVRNRLLRSLFARHDASAKLASYDYEEADTALQDRIDKSISLNCIGKHIITIATHEPEEELDSGAAEQDNDGGSVPDAWIYNKDRERCDYCLLIECKRGGNRVAEDQIRRHVKIWFGMVAADVHRIDLTWQDVLKVVEQEHLVAQVDNQHERQYVLSGLIGFLNQYGYRLFKGFDFRGLGEVPGFGLASAITASSERGGLLQFLKLGPPPNFRLRTDASGPSTEKVQLFRFEALGAVPAFRLCTNQGDRYGH